MRFIFLVFGYSPQPEHEARDRQCKAVQARQAMANARRSATLAALDAQATVSAGYLKQRRRTKSE